LEQQRPLVEQNGRVEALKNDMLVVDVMAKITYQNGEKGLM